MYKVLRRQLPKYLSAECHPVTQTSKSELPVRLNVFSFRLLPSVESRAVWFDCRKYRALRLSKSQTFWRNLTESCSDCPRELWSAIDKVLGSGRVVQVSFYVFLTRRSKSPAMPHTCCGHANGSRDVQLLDFVPISTTDVAESATPG